jgi:hypothetical protein
MTRQTLAVLAVLLVAASVGLFVLSYYAPMPGFDARDWKTSLLKAGAPAAGVAFGLLLVLVDRRRRR